MKCPKQYTVHSFVGLGLYVSKIKKVIRDWRFTSIGLRFIYFVFVTHVGPTLLRYVDKRVANTLKVCIPII